MATIYTIEHIEAGFIVGQAARKLFRYPDGPIKCPLSGIVTVIHPSWNQKRVVLESSYNSGRIIHQGSKVEIQYIDKYPICVKMDRLCYSIEFKGFFLLNNDGSCKSLCSASRFYHQLSDGICKVTREQMEAFPKVIDEYRQEGWKIVHRSSKVSATSNTEMTYSYSLEFKGKDREFIIKDNNTSLEKLVGVVYMLETFAQTSSCADDMLIINHLEMKTSIADFDITLRTNTLSSLRQFVDNAKRF